MAYFRNTIRTQLEPQQLIRLGDGVNRSNGPFDMKKSEAYTSLNTCSGKYPALTTRNGMAKPFDDVTGPLNAIGVRNNSEIHILDGTTWKKWGGSAWETIATELANTPSKIFDFVRETDRLTILVNGTNRKYYDGTNVFDLWEVREGAAAPWEWEHPFVIDNKMYVKIISATPSIRDAIGIYDIVENTWSVGAVAPISANALNIPGSVIPTWRYPVVYGNSIFVRVTLKVGGDFFTQVLKYRTSNNTWSEVTPPSTSGNSLLAQWAVVGNYIMAYFDPSLFGTNYMLKYDIEANSWKELTDGEQRSWFYGIAYNDKLYTFGTGYEGIYDVKKETWDSYSISSREFTLLNDLFVLGTKIYARSDDGKISIYDTVDNSWDVDTGLEGFGPSAIYSSSLDYVILTRGTGNIVRWFFTTSEKFGDDALFQAPKTNLYTTDEYRLFTLENTEMRCSDITVPTEWIFGDSTSITISSMRGIGTAITYYKNMVIAWSDTSMHILMGESTDNFRFVERIESGCLSARSFCINDGTLYFADKGSIKSFTGGVTREISQKVRDYLENINFTHKSKVCMGNDGKHIYISFPYLTSTTNNMTLVYDTQTDTWFPWNKGFNELVNMGESLYGIDSTGVWKLNSGTNDNGTAITWSHETGAWNEGVLRQQKVISNLYMLVDLPTNSTFTIHYSNSVDNDDWALLYTFTASSDEQNTRIQIPTNILQPINWYRLKFSGTGPMTLFYLEPHIRIKTR